jgi:type IV secretion system protein VirD4
MFDWQVGVAIVGGILVVAALAAVLASRSERKDAVTAWDAGFAKSDKTGLAGKEGIYLGHEPKTDTILHYNGDRHIMTLGPNGSGKSMRLLYENLMTLRDWSLLVIDPKGELAALTGAERAKHGKVVYLNPYRVRGLPSHGFNPVATLDPSQDNFLDDAMGLAEAMIRIEKDEKEPHWAQSAQDLVCALIMYAALQPAPQTKDDPDNRNFAFVRSCLGQSMIDFKDTVREMRRIGIEREWDELSIKASRFQDITPESRELTSIISNAVTQTRWLDSRPVKADTSKGMIDFAAMKTEPTTIYLILPANRLATQSTWLRLVITCCLQKLIRDAVPGRVPVMLMLDEFANLGHLPMIENTMALMRGYGVKMWSVFQDLSQLKAIYGERWESFISNAGVVQAFAPQDIQTAAYLSERSGLTAREHTNWSWSGRSPSFSGNQQGMPLLLPQAVRGLGNGETVIFSHVANGPVRAFAPFPTLPTS